jgi:hypothetical protein
MGCLSLCARGRHLFSPCMIVRESGVYDINKFYF